MELLSEFFKTNIIVVHFVYPLIFFLMGFGIFLKNTFDSQFYLSKSLQYLALFGIIHGISDWGKVFIPIQKAYLANNYIFVLESLRLIVNAISFYFLFYFGMHLLIQTKRWCRKFLFIPLFVFLIWLTNFILLMPILLNEHNQNWWFALSDIWSRYLLAFPGGVISSYALFLQHNQFQKFGVPSMTRTLFFTFISVGLYAVTSGLIVPYSPVLPAILFNSDLFFDTTGIPVELLRGISGLFMIFFILKILKVFDIEYQNYFYEVKKQKAVMDERDHIARDLHDGMIQSLYATGLHIERVRTMLSLNQNTKEGEVKAELQTITKKLNAIILEIRGYIRNLKMPINSQSSLKEDIERLIDEMNFDKQLNIAVHYNYSGQDLPLSKTVQIYYILKEALSNTIRHANATQASIMVSGNNRELKVEVIDNGIGMDLVENRLNSERYFLKQGICNMRQRAQLIGAILTVTSKKGQGTKVCLQINEGRQTNEKEH